MVSIVATGATVLVSKAFGPADNSMDWKPTFQVQVQLLVSPWWSQLSDKEQRTVLLNESMRLCCTLCSMKGVVSIFLDKKET